VRNIGSFSATIQNIAISLVGQYGDDAQAIAVLKAAELAAQGDIDGLALWDNIIACIASIEDGAISADLLN